MKTTIQRTQAFYTKSLKAHGHQNREFQIERDDSGNPLVHQFTGNFPNAHYVPSVLDSIYIEVAQVFDFEATNIYFVVIENGSRILKDQGVAVGGVAGAFNKNRGFLFLPSEFAFFVVAHELGHAFCLEHNFHDNAFIMSYGNNVEKISECNADYLSTHPYFNPNSSLSLVGLDAKLVEGRYYKRGSARHYVDIAISARGGLLHQAFLFVKTTDQNSVAYGQLEVQDYLRLPSVSQINVRWAYNGIVPSSPNETLLDLDTHDIFVRVIDTHGNFKDEHFWLDVAIEAPENLKFSLDADIGPRNQKGTTVIVEPEDSFAVQIFAEDIKDMGRFRLSFEYDYTQVSPAYYIVGDALEGVAKVDVDFRKPEEGRRVFVMDILPGYVDDGGWFWPVPAPKEGGLFLTLDFKTLEKFHSTEITLIKAIAEWQQIYDYNADVKLENATILARTQEQAKPTPDFDGDGKVDFVDFLMFVDVFGTTEDEAEYEERFDLDEDGAIGFSDFLIFTTAFGK